MILSSDTPPAEWTSEHAQLLREFLASPTGLLALEWALYNGPDFPDGSDVNKTLVSCGECKGYLRALKSLISLTTEQPKMVQAPEVTYPDLDDEDAWKGLTEA